MKRIFSIFSLELNLLNWYYSVHSVYTVPIPVIHTDTIRIYCEDIAKAEPASNPGNHQELCVWYIEMTAEIWQVVGWNMWLVTVQFLMSSSVFLFCIILRCFVYICVGGYLSSHLFNSSLPPKYSPSICNANPWKNNLTSYFRLQAKTENNFLFFFHFNRFS